MFPIDHLKAFRVEKRLDRFGEGHLVFSYVGQVFLSIPFKLHGRTLPHSASLNHERWLKQTGVSVA